MSENRDFIIQEFVAEFRESAEALEQGVLRLEREPGNTELLNDIFRPVHSLKGASSLMGFGLINEFSHTFESLLDALRKGKKQVTPGVIDLSLRCIDVIRQMVSDVAAGGDGSRVDITAPVEGIRAELAAPAAATAAPQSGGSMDVFLSAARQHCAVLARTLAEAVGGHADPAKAAGALARAFRGLKASAEFMGFHRLLSFAAAAEELVERVRADGTAGPELWETCEGARAAVQGFVETVKATGGDAYDAGAVLERMARPGAGDRAAKDRAPAAGRDGTLRISMLKMDRLVNLMGELIVNQSRLDIIDSRLQGGGDDPAALARELRSVNVAMGRMIGDMYAAIMGMRMVSVGTLFGRFPRVVRDIARRQGKEIELVVAGEETEIDKNIIDEVADPLSHLLRNAADHGIEPPADREAAGKPRAGTVTLRAWQENGSAMIAVEDDGKGIDPARLREKAVREKILTLEQAAALSDQEALALIFRPGFSTAPEVTDISGRGVGMDVVKTNIERLRGKVSVRSVPGKGTKIVLELPLTMAIIEALMVTAGAEMFAIPLFSIDSIVKVDNDRIRTVGGKEVITLYGRTIGLARLGRLLNIREKAAGGTKSYVVIVDNGTDDPVGLIVDSLKEKQKVVVKPLGEEFAGTAGLSGVTILGDGQVALILDPRELSAMAQGDGAQA